MLIIKIKDKIAPLAVRTVAKQREDCEPPGGELSVA